MRTSRCLRAVVGLLVSLLGSLAFAAGPLPPLDGAWHGTASVGPQKLRCLIHLRHDGAAWSGTFESVDQHSPDIKLDHVSVDGDRVSFAIAAIAFRYQGTRSGADHIAGKFTQGPVTFDLDLDRGELAEVAPARPQTPKPPFPYDVVEVSVDNPAAHGKLGCTLTRPRGKGRVPAVVLITGSGAQDRDETVFFHKPFAVLADAITRKGVAVLRCDDRGVAQSLGDIEGTTLDFAGDVQREVEALRARDDIDGARIGLIGHSEGGLIAPIVASRDPKIAFVVLLAGSGLRGDKLLVLQNRRQMELAQVPAATIEKSLPLYDQLQQLAMHEPDPVERVKQLRALLQAHPQMVSSDVETQQLLMVYGAQWMHLFLQLDPAVYLKQLHVPLLAINGSLDSQVLAKENLAAIHAALAGDRDVTVRELPGLNHLLQRCQTGAVAEYQTIEETMAPAALDLVSGWVAQHAAAKR